MGEQGVVSDEDKKYRSFLVYPNYYESFLRLLEGDEEKAMHFLVALVIYGTEQVRTYKSGIIKAIMASIERTIDAGFKRYLVKKGLHEEEVSSLPKMSFNDAGTIYDLGTGSEDSIGQFFD